MPKLIGLNGFKGSGKNTVGRFIAEWGERNGLVVVQRGFADLLKLSAARSLGIYSAQSIQDAVVLMDSLKESGTVDIAIPEQSILKAISGREFLKWFGTEGHRDVFGDDFWVDQILPDSHRWPVTFGFGEKFDIAVITDLRFANEARRVKKLRGTIWNVDREYDPDSHISEQPLGKCLIDLVIPNRSTLEALEWIVTRLMTSQFQTHSPGRIDEGRH